MGGKEDVRNEYDNNESVESDSGSSHSCVDSDMSNSEVVRSFHNYIAKGNNKSCYILCLTYDMMYKCNYIISDTVAAFTICSMIVH